MKYKYIILDFGKVIAGPSTGYWDFTPTFLKLIKDIDIDKFNEKRKNHSKILSSKITTLEEEYNMFLKFYDGVLSELNIPNYNKKISEQIAYDRTYKNDKYELYENIYDELNKLKKKYTLILLTDNWPCVSNYLKDYDLEKYFDKIYISSMYGVEKINGLLFDYPIKDYNIKLKEALFIDDYEINLDNAKEKGLDVLLMDRNNSVKESKYKIIHNLYDL